MMRRCAGLLVVLVGVGGLASGATLLVPSQYPTLQAAINAAVDGDVVQVEATMLSGPGNRDVRLLGKAITVEPLTTCVIDCESAGRAFICDSGETPASKIGAFTIRNGRTSFGNGGGAAVRIVAASPTLWMLETEHSCVANNANGGGVYVEGGAPYLYYCTLDGRSDGGQGGGLCAVSASVTCEGGSFNGTAWYGGAIYASGGTLNLTYCDVQGDTMYPAWLADEFRFGGLPGGDGGGLRAESCIVNIRHSGFFGCTTHDGQQAGMAAPGGAGGSGAAISCVGGTLNVFGVYVLEATCGNGGVQIDGGPSGHGGAGAIWSSADQTMLRSCLIGACHGGHDAAGPGGGTGAVVATGAISIVNCTIVDNVGRTCGGVEAEANILNSILWGNSTGNASQPAYRQQYSGGASPNYSFVMGWSAEYGGQSNSDEDPQFLPGSHYRPLATSQCVERGDPAFVPLPGETDLLELPRLANGKGVGAPRVDIGAYELRGVHYGDLNCDGVVDFADIDPFVMALSSVSQYQSYYVFCNWYNGDCNGDLVVDLADIDPFVALLSQ